MVASCQIKNGRGKKRKKRKMGKGRRKEEGVGGREERRKGNELENSEQSFDV